MDNKKIIIIIGVIAIIVAAAIVFMVMTATPYERMEITPNGTSIEVPANQTVYQGSLGGAKAWKWHDGALITYNNHEDINNLMVVSSGFSALDDLVKNGEKQDLDGVTGYVVNADELLQIHVFEFIKVNYNGKFYCIPLKNDTTQDNLIIISKDKDIAVHMAKSVIYKDVYPKSAVDNITSSIGDTVSDLESEANNYINGTDLNDVKSTIEDNAGNIKSKANDYLNNSDLNNAKSQIEKIAGGLF